MYKVHLFKCPYRSDPDHRKSIIFCLLPCPVCYVSTDLYYVLPLAGIYNII